jgi:hypothetical protein
MPAEEAIGKTRAAERGGGGKLPRGAGGPSKFFVGPQSFLCVKYFRAKDKISVFLG